MLRLRQYKPCDADVIASWCSDERTFRRWSSDRFGDFPISGRDINDKYIANNGDCPDGDNFYPLTAFDEKGVVGSLILRYTDEARETVRFGFVIVDGARRGAGYGKKMLLLAQKYAFELLGANKVTIGVFHNNMPAYCCYKSVGFTEVPQEKTEEFKIFGETWRVIELEMSRADYEKRSCEEKKLIDGITSEGEDISRRLSEMREQGKTKTATFKQLMGRKLQLSDALTVIKEYSANGH